MKYTAEYFDYILERRNTRSSKWDGCNQRFGIEPEVEMLPMWVADMDFRAPQEVIDTLMERVKMQAYGYSIKPDYFYEAIIRWVERRYHWKIKKEWILNTPGVIPGFIVAIRTFTEPGDGIIIQPPVYMAFSDGVKKNDRKLVYNPLIEKDGEWYMDFEDLEKKVKDPDNKMMILCNPHNPIGRAWTKEELEKVGNLCAAHGVFLISDEIHADFMMNGKEHQPVSTISEKIQQNTFTHYSPSKTFNLTGLQTAYVIIPNDELRKKYAHHISASRIFEVNWFGPDALVTAYNECEGYVEAVCEYIGKNMDYMERFLQERLPMLRMKKSQATYTEWVDFRGTGMNTEEIENFSIRKARIGVDMGSWFGPGGEGFLRFNLACPRKTLEKGLKQLEDSFL